VSVADRSEPVASCSEWHADGTGGEEDRASYLAAAAPARMMGEALPRSPRASLARLRGRVALAKVLARTGPTALVTAPGRDQPVVVTAACVTGPRHRRREDDVIRIEGEIVVKRPVDEVFDFVADARNEPLYNPRMLRAEKLTPGPIGLGTRFRDEIKSMGRPAEITMEIVGYERPRQLTDSIQLSTMDIRGGFTFDPVPAGTRMRWSWELLPRGVFKLLTPLVARIGRRQEQRIWGDLKRVMEAQPAPSSTARL
jgi:uncharacterized membrane protein